MIKKYIINRDGFTLVEVLAVLVIVAILAIIAIPKYMNAADAARQKAAQGQIGEVKGRLHHGLGRYMMENNGSIPTTGADLVTAVNTYSADACPTLSTTEGDFTFICAGAAGAKTVTITVSAVGGIALSSSVVATYNFSSAG